MRGRDVHAFTLLLAIAAWIFGVYRADSAWWLLVFVVAGLIFQVQAGSTRWSPNHFVHTAFRTIRYVAPIFLVYTLLTALFLPDAGGQLWWRGPYVPMIGRMTLTSEGVLKAVTGALRLWALLLGMAALARRISPDDVTVWLGRWLARLGLTLSMVITLIPLLQRERRRLSEYVLLRGGFHRGPERFSHRIRSTGIVLQALLANGLERSWVLAESMHVRGYSATGRTLYPRKRWSSFDTWFAAGILLGVLLSFFLTPRAVSSAIIVLFVIGLGGRTRGTSLHY